MSFFDVLLNAIREPELRHRLLFTLGMLAVYRLGSQIPLPGIHLGHLADFIGSIAASKPTPVAMVKTEGQSAPSCPA